MVEVTTRSEQRHGDINNQSFDERFEAALENAIQFAKDQNLGDPSYHVLGSIIQQVKSGLEVQAMIGQTPPELLANPNSRMSKMKNRAVSPQHAREVIMGATKAILDTFGTQEVAHIQDFWLESRKVAVAKGSDTKVEQRDGLVTMMEELGKGQGKDGEDIVWNPLVPMNIPTTVAE